MPAKLNEREVYSPAGNWVPVANYRQFVGVGVLENADSTETVTVQLRKATDASGTNPANHGTAVVGTSSGADQDLVVSAQAYASELGKTGGGLAYTHVCALVTDTGSPENSYGIVIRGDGRFGV